MLYLMACPPQMFGNGLSTPMTFCGTKEYWAPEAPLKRKGGYGISPRGTSCVQLGVRMGTHLRAEHANRPARNISRKARCLWPCA